MAHAMSLQWAQDHATTFEIRSRGIRANKGDPTTPEAILVLSKAGINWQGRSQVLSSVDLEWADEVWGMTQEHVDVATKLGSMLSPENSPRYELLALTEDLLDPLNSGLSAYEELFETLKQRLPNRLAAI